MTQFNSFSLVIESTWKKILNEYLLSPFFIFIPTSSTLLLSPRKAKYSLWLEKERKCWMLVRVGRGSAHAPILQPVLSLKQGKQWNPGKFGDLRIQESVLLSHARTQEGSPSGWNSLSHPGCTKAWGRCPQPQKDKGTQPNLLYPEKGVKDHYFMISMLSSIVLFTTVEKRYDPKPGMRP